MIILSALLGVLFLYLLQNYLYNRFWMKNLSVDLGFSEESAVEGEELSLIETVMNRKWLPLPAIMVKFQTSRNLIFTDNENSKITDNYYRKDMMSMMMYQKITRTLMFRCSHRGYYTIKRVDVVCPDMFLSYERVIALDLDIRLYVYPKPVEADRIAAPFQKMLGTVLTRRYINEDPFEFRGIREYQPYDNLKAVNWKASAKTGSLKVNANNDTASQQVKIMLNMELDTIWIYEDIQEESIRLAATLAVMFINQGIPVSVSTNAKDMITHEVPDIPAGSGRNHIRTLMEIFARLDTSLKTDAFVPVLSQELMSATENDYLILISAYQKEDLRKLLLSQQPKLEYVWILPTKQDQKISVSEDLAAHVIFWEITDK